MNLRFERHENKGHGVHSMKIARKSGARNCARPIFVPLDTECPGGFCVACGCEFLHSKKF